MYRHANPNDRVNIAKIEIAAQAAKGRRVAVGKRRSFLRKARKPSRQLRSGCGQHLLGDCLPPRPALSRQLQAPRPTLRGPNLGDPGIGWVLTLGQSDDQWLGVSGPAGHARALNVPAAVKLPRSPRDPPLADHFRWSRHAINELCKSSAHFPRWRRSFLSQP